MDASTSNDVQRLQVKTVRGSDIIQERERERERKKTADAEEDQSCMCKDPFWIFVRPFGACTDGAIIPFQAEVVVSSVALFSQQGRFESKRSEETRNDRCLNLSHTMMSLR